MGTAGLSALMTRAIRYAFCLEQSIFREARRIKEGFVLDFLACHRIELADYLFLEEASVVSDYRSQILDSYVNP